ncbi:MAG TPA: tryptophan 7-halogenase [Verrucomicrobiales bacterium]|nr:tryptophan 7-halogenase [Verrucomicrobiales bacterium]
MKISSVVVLGAGSAGFMAALTLKTKLPHLSVRVVRSPEIGVIGVGEATTPALSRHLFDYLKLKPRDFYTGAQPTYKMGIRFLWGPRQDFVYTFAFEHEYRHPELARNNGFYYSDERPWLGQASAFMLHDKVFARRPDGLPQFHNKHAFHIENVTFIGWLEQCCRGLGVEITDATVSVETGGEGIAALITKEGERITADLYVDASGFRSELLGRALAEPYRSYADTLFCDRAVVGGWNRKSNDPIIPYTIAETMDSGWCWQIDHEKVIHRGYVYCSAFISDDAAREEFLRKNPKADPADTRVVKFRSGRHERSWVGNVVGVGNSVGFVEPLESSALQILCIECRTLADSLLDSLCDPPPTLIKLYNRYNGDAWDDIRNFLAVHYKFNTRLDTPFWLAARQDVALHGAADIVEWYQENGPSVVAGVTLIHESNAFRMDGFLALLTGQNVPHQKAWTLPPAEQEFWSKYYLQLAGESKRAMTSEEVFTILRDPALKWA